MAIRRGPKIIQYDPEIGIDICEQIATLPYGIKKLKSLNDHWPAPKIIFRWQLEDKEFRERYMAAKRAQVEVLVDQIIDIADDTSQDTIIKINKNGDEEAVCNNEFINRSRIRIDSRKWLAAKLAPKLYGEKVFNETSVTLKQEEAVDILKLE